MPAQRHAAFSRPAVVSAVVAARDDPAATCAPMSVAPGAPSLLGQAGYPAEMIALGPRVMEGSPLPLPTIDGEGDLGPAGLGDGGVAERVCQALLFPAGALRQVRQGRLAGGQGGMLLQGRRREQARAGESPLPSWYASRSQLHAP